MSENFSRRSFLQSAALSGAAIATRKAWASSLTSNASEPAGSGGLTQFVDVFIGTGGHGHTYPGATVPFGMVQLSPDTGLGDWDHCSGYHYSDTSIMGFSHTHLSGTGAADLLDVLVMPAVGPVRMEPGPSNNPGAGYRSRFSHAEEHGEPGYYSVLLTDCGIKAELTATARAGMHRYTFPADPTSHFIIDLAHGTFDKENAESTRILSAEMRVAGNDTLVGGRRVGEWADGRFLYFAMRFSRPFSAAQLTSGAQLLDASITETKGAVVKCVLSFPTTAGEVIQVKVGLSAVSIEGALKNMDTEIPSWDFETVRRAAKAAWERELQKIVIETPRADHKKIFYSALYHALVAPTLFSDADGQYRGMDLEVHRLPAGEKNYTTYSLWDTYRALHPLFTLIQTERLPGMLNTLIRMAEQSSAGVPVWPLQACETGCMIGYHSAAVLAEACEKGVPGVDFKKAYAIWRKRAFIENYRGLVQYRDLGFIACDQEAEAVSKTLEYAYDDWAMARLARAAGAMDDYRQLLDRSRNYKNVFDSSITFMRGRLADGTWASPFDPRGMGHTKKWRDFTESNSWEATFLNQHDVKEYMALFGGERGFLQKLDELFNQSSDLPPDAPPDIAGMVGQYAHGNEPGHHVAYLYSYAGVPYRTQSRVRFLLETMHHNDPDGLAGNEDCGQMSAWYILSALGFYAVDPVSGNYVFGSPLFDRATIDIGEGRRLIIETIGNGVDTPYVQSVTWNGKPYTKSWFSHTEIGKGGTFVLKMSEHPNEQFGVSSSDRPPSFV
ncbi:MAG: GH92 family glycosyl hydrolase [Terriglobales bacterium]|jgi:predicted alpha-1,2-mannosidase